MKAGQITALEVQQGNKERVNVYLDGEFAFGLNLMDAAQLRKGQQLSEADITRLLHGDAVVKAVERAVHFLQFRPRSSAEVRRNLEQKAYPPEVIQATLERLQTLAYLDDAAFARYWVENRDTFKPRSPRVLRMELQQKGISADIIQEVLSDLDANHAAYRAAHQKLAKYKGLTVREFKQKLGGFLQRRGFAYEVVDEVLHQLIDELQTEAPDYFLSPNDEG